MLFVGNKHINHDIVINQEVEKLKVGLIKFLGIVIDNKLVQKYHINYIHNNKDPQ